MDNRYFRVPGRATGRLQLKRPGYGMEVGRVIEHAKTNGGAFEINSSPDRLHLSALHTRLACNAGIKIAIPTDAHSLRKLDDSTWESIKLDAPVWKDHQY